VVLVRVFFHAAVLRRGAQGQGIQTGEGGHHGEEAGGLVYVQAHGDAAVLRRFARAVGVGERWRIGRGVVQAPTLPVSGAGEGFLHGLPVAGWQVAFAGAFAQGAEVEGGGRDVAVRLADEIAPDVRVLEMVLGGDFDGAPDVGVVGIGLPGIESFVGIERGEVCRIDAVERAPNAMTRGGQEVGDAALPFSVGEGEGEAVSVEACRREKLMTGAKAVHLRRAEVGSVGEVECGRAHGAGSV